MNVKCQLLKLTPLITICIIFFASCSDDNEPIQLDVPCLSGTLETGLLAFYPFYNGSAADFSSNSNDLNNMAAVPTLDRNGQVDCAFKLDNSASIEQFLFLEDPSFLDGLNEFSISLWYMPQDSSRSVGDYELLIGRGDTLRCPDRNGEWSVGLYDCRKAVFGRTNSVWANPISGLDCTAELIAQTDVWKHVVIVQVEDAMSLHINGEFQGISFGDANCINPPQVQDQGTLFLGKYFTGVLDDVLIYDRALSSEEIQQLFAWEPCCVD